MRVQVDHRDYFGVPHFRTLTDNTTKLLLTRFKERPRTSMTARKVKGRDDMAYVSFLMPTTNSTNHRRLSLVLPIPDARIPIEDLRSPAEVAGFFKREGLDFAEDYVLPGIVYAQYAKFSYEDWSMLVQGGSHDPSRDIYNLNRTVGERWQTVFTNGALGENVKEAYNKVSLHYQIVLGKQLVWLRQAPPPF